jgi:hypothetical protein
VGAEQVGVLGRPPADHHRGHRRHRQQPQQPRHRPPEQDQGRGPGRGRGDNEREAGAEQALEQPVGVGAEDEDAAEGQRAGDAGRPEGPAAEPPFELGVVAGPGSAVGNTAAR